MTMRVAAVESTKGTPEYWLRDIDIGFGIRSRIYENGSGSMQEDCMDNAGWLCAGGLRPRPIPDTTDRAANREYANRYGYYWMKCRRCGEMTGGHERERNRACERRFTARVEKILPLYDNPPRTAAIGLVSAESDKIALAELAMSSHFKWGFARIRCSCGTAEQHNNRVQALSYRFWTNIESRP